MSDMLHLCAKDKKEKVSIFRNLFKGREDVFAKYWVSRRTGKQGYSPVCKNEWIPQICRKPCEKCGNKDYVPLDDFWIEKDKFCARHQTCHFNERVKNKDGNSYCWGWSGGMLYGPVVEEMRD